MGKKRVLIISVLISILLVNFVYSQDSGDNERIKNQLYAEARISLGQLGSPNEGVKKRSAGQLANMGKDILPLLIESLQNEAFPGREEIPLILADINDQTSINLLTGFIGSKYANNALSHNSIIALKRFKNPSSVDGLISALGNPGLDEKSIQLVIESMQEITTHNFGRKEQDWRVWWEKNKQSIINGLNEIISLSEIQTVTPSDAALNDLLIKMKSTNGEVRYNAVIEYTASESPEKEKILPQVIHMATDSLENVSYAAIRALKKMKSSSSIKTLTDIILSSSNIRAKLEAISAISEIDDIRGVIPVVQSMDSKDYAQLETGIIEALHQFNDSIEEKEIIGNLNSWNTYIQRFCVQTISNRNLVKYVPELEKTLGADDDENVKRNIIRALGNLKASTSVPIFIAMFQKDPVSSLNVDIITALNKITGVNRGVGVDLWIDWYSDNKSNFEASISQYKDQISRQASVIRDTKLFSRKWQTRLKRINEILVSPSEEQIDMLVPIMESDPVPLCRKTALNGVQAYWMPNSQGLIDRLASFDKIKRDSTVKILILCKTGFTDILIKNLNSNNYIVSKNCAEVLGSIRDAKAIEPLVQKIRQLSYKGIPPSPYARALSAFGMAALNAAAPLIKSQNENESNEGFYVLAGLDKRYYPVAAPYIVNKMKTMDTFLKEEAASILGFVIKDKVRGFSDSDDWRKRKAAKYDEFKNLNYEEAAVRAMQREYNELLDMNINNLLSQDTFAYNKAEDYLLKNINEESIQRLIDMYKPDNSKLMESIKKIILENQYISFKGVSSNISSQNINTQLCALRAANLWDNRKDFAPLNKELYQTLLSSEREVRQLALTLMAEFALPENADTFRKAIKTNDSYLKVQGARGLAMLYSVQDIQELKHEMDNIVEPEYKIQMAGWLAMLGDNSGIELIKQLLQNAQTNNFQMLANVIELLPAVTGPENEDILLSIAANAPEKIKGRVVSVLGYSGGTKSLEYLSALPKSDNADFNKSVQKSINMIKEDQIVF